MVRTPERIGEGFWEVPSFSGQGSYEVNLERGTCTCPAFRYAPDRPCKHVVVARTFERIEGKGEYLREIASRMLSLAFEPPRAGETPAASMDRVTRVLGWIYTPEELERAAWRRHRKVLAATGFLGDEEGAR